VRRYAPRVPAKPHKRPSVKPTGQQPSYGRSKWKPMADRRNRHQRSRNASMAGMAGYRSNAIAVKPRPAFRLNTSADTRHADPEIGSRAEMPIMPDAALFATRAYDQAHATARDRAL
jgi:hypothetical protein